MIHMYIPPPPRPPPRPISGALLADAFIANAQLTEMGEGERWGEGESLRALAFERVRACVRACVRARMLRGCARARVRNYMRATPR